MRKNQLPKKWRNTYSQIKYKQTGKNTGFWKIQYHVYRGKTIKCQFSVKHFGFN